jgi:hypothetical protein
MTFSEEIKEHKDEVSASRQAAMSDADGLVDALELRIDELDSDLDNAHEDLENEQALTKKLKGLIDGGLVGLVSKLVAGFEQISFMSRNNDAPTSPETIAGLADICITKAKESMP